MEKQLSCAECVNLGRAVYCMQCVRIRKGTKDMFLPNKASAALPYREQTGKNNASHSIKC